MTQGINELKGRIKDLKIKIKELVDSKDTQWYDYHIDERRNGYDEIEIQGYKYKPAQVFKKMNPKAYNEGFLDFKKRQIDDLQCEIEEAQQGIEEIKEEE